MRVLEISGTNSFNYYARSQDPTIALLNHKVDETPKHIQSLIFYVLLGAKITISMAWKKTKPSLVETKQNISWIMSQEKIMTKLKAKVCRFELFGENGHYISRSF